VGVKPIKQMNKKKARCPLLGPKPCLALRKDLLALRTNPKSCLTLRKDLPARHSEVMSGKGEYGKRAHRTNPKSCLVRGNTEK
jgi:hypothetical protein